jgi:hypothetical protein
MAQGRSGQYEQGHYFGASKRYSDCTLSSSVQDNCLMWISGFVAGVFSQQVLAEAKNQKPTICLPDGFSGRQARVVIERYMQDHPEQLHLPAFRVASAALDEAFPCGK